MIYIWPITFIVLVFMQEKLFNKKIPNIYFHVFVFLFLLSKSKLELSFMFLIGGIVFETALFGMGNVSQQKRIPHRYKKTIFLTTILYTFLISIIMYKHNFFSASLQLSIDYKKYYIALFSVLMVFFIKFKGKKWS